MKKILIVNPFVSQKYLVEQLDGQADVYALFTCDVENLDTYSKKDMTYFTQQLCIPEAHIFEHLDELRHYEFDYIVNGSEESTVLFDRLAFELTPHLANDPSTSARRFDKLCMQEAMQEAGLPYIMTTEIKISEIMDTPEVLFGYDYPIFCKPQQGYGSVGAFRADSAEDALYKLLMCLNINNDYIIQTFVEGDEYVVDTFSVNGKHYIASIQKYTKKDVNGKPMYRHCEVLTDVEQWRMFEDFATAMLDALDVKNGFAHSELMYAPHAGIKLIELNNRISGCKGMINACAQASGLSSHTDLLIDFLHNNEMKSSQPSSDVYSTTVTVFKMGGGIVKELNRQDLTTLQQMVWCQPVGSRIPMDQEYSLLDAVAYLVCSGHKKDVMKDIELIFNREQKGELL